MTGLNHVDASGDAHQVGVHHQRGERVPVKRSAYACPGGALRDAYHHDQPVLEPDLVEPAATARPRSAVGDRAGARRSSAFLLYVGAGVRLGALNLYRRPTRPLTDEQYVDAVTMADIAAEAVLVLQTNAPPGELAAELEANANFEFVVHQASGMAAVQLGESVAQALIRLKRMPSATADPSPMSLRTSWTGRYASIHDAGTRRPGREGRRPTVLGWEVRWS